MPSMITRFVADEGQYVFPLLQSWSDNFGSLNTKISQLSGADGGIDEYGAIRAPKAVGQVTVNMTIFAESDAEATARSDELHKIVTWGKGRLYMQPADDSADERWCEARVASVPRQMNLNQHNDYSRTVQLTFVVSYPYWLTQGTFPWAWGDGTLWGANEWGGGASPQICSGTQTDFTISRTGTAAVQPTILVRCDTGQSAGGVTIQRLRGNLILDEVAWGEALAEGDELTIDAWRFTVMKNGADAYDNRFSEKRLRLMQLDSGDNTIRVIMPDAGDICTVTIRYYEAWN